MFKNMKIGLRLSLSYALILIFMVALIFVNLNQIKVVDSNLDRIVNINNERLQLANNMVDYSQQITIAICNAILSKDSERARALKDSIESFRDRYGKEFEELKDLTVEDDEMSFIIFSRMDSSMANSKRLNNEVMDLAIAGRDEEATRLLNDEAIQASQEWIRNAGELITHNEERSLLRYQEAQDYGHNTRSMMLWIGIIAVIITIIISVLMTLSIISPLQTSLHLADMIASKDLTGRMDTENKRKDEFGLMLTSLIGMIEILREQMQEISEGANVLASSSAEILASTTQIASGSAETATAITETTTTVEEVRQAAQLSSQKAKNLSDSSNQVSQVSQNGGKAVNETIEGMNHIRNQMDRIARTVIRLSEQSQSIGGIIATVTDLADQSNLLAVNAAIEAAKAGEQGKGFAVVAQEIRNLAEQSKQATVQVRNILNDIQKATGEAVLATEQGNKAVEEGVEKSTQAGDAIRILSESSEAVAQASSQIVASSHQQLIGMDQIGTAMQNINQAGLETSASMSQTEESVKNLHKLGQRLKEIIEQFKF